MSSSIERMRMEHIRTQHGYERPELGGNTRKLDVWSYEVCRAKLEEAKANNRLTEFFLRLCHLWGFYVHGHDPMMADWMDENFQRCASIYDQMEKVEAEDFTAVAPDDTIEEFTA